MSDASECPFEGFEMSGGAPPWPVMGAVPGGVNPWLGFAPGLSPAGSAGNGASLANGQNAGVGAGAGGPLGAGAFDFALDPVAAQRALAASAASTQVQAASAKVRKPYTITKQRERWTEAEHEGFLEALKLHGRAWKKIEEHIGTKSAVQIRSHAQKFFSKLQREAQKSGSVDRAGNGDGPSESESTVTVIPPARPKRKPAHPYPRKAPDPGVPGGASRDAAVVNGATGAAALKGGFGMPAGGDPNVAAAAAAAFMMAMGNGTAGFGGVDPASAAAAWPVAAGGFPPFPGAPTTNPASPYATALHSQMLALAQVNPAALAALGAGQSGTESSARISAQVQAQQAQQQQAQVQQAAAAQANAARAQQQFMAALAMIGGGSGAGQAGAPMAKLPPMPIPPPPSVPAPTPPGLSADIFSAMLTAVAAGNTAAGAPNASAPALSDTNAFANWAAAMGAATSGAGGGKPPGAFDGSAGAAAGNADQMAALANVMMFFPGMAPGSTGAAGVVAPATAGVSSGMAANTNNSNGQATSSGGTGTNLGSENGRDDAATKEHRAERKSALEKRKRGSKDAPKEMSTGAGRGDQSIAVKAQGKGHFKSSGSGGGSGSGSGGSAQTGRGANAQHGFESSSQRENSPNSEKGEPGAIEA